MPSWAREPKMSFSFWQSFTVKSQKQILDLPISVGLLVCDWADFCRPRTACWGEQRGLMGDGPFPALLADRKRSVLGSVQGAWTKEWKPCRPLAAESICWLRSLYAYRAEPYLIKGLKGPVSCMNLPSSDSCRFVPLSPSKMIKVSFKLYLLGML